MVSYRYITNKTLSYWCHLVVSTQPGGWVSLFLQQKPLLSPAVPVADAVARFVASLRALSDAQVAEATAALAEFGDEERQRALGHAAKVAVFWWEKWRFLWRVSGEWWEKWRFLDDTHW